jgi:DNA-binding CsgD family transcriptional regulator
MSADDAFLDLLYQAPTQPSAWVGAMARLSDMIGGSGAWLSTINVIDGAGHGIWARTDPRLVEAFFAYFAARNPLNNVPNVDAFMRGWLPRIVTENDLIASDALKASEFYNDFLMPLQATSVAMIRLARHPQSQSTSVINIGRAPGKGPFEAQEIGVAHALHAHMMRAFKLSTEVARARLFAGALGVFSSASGRGVVIVDETSRALSANVAAERCIRAGFLTARNGRLNTSDHSASLRLQALIASACAAPPAPRIGGIMALLRPEQGSPLTVSVAPLHDDDQGVFLTERLAVVILSDPSQAVKPAESILRVIYGMTPMEARLALALLDGGSLKETAGLIGVSEHTAKDHLSRVFDKTGVNRQAALAALLTRLALHG